MTFKAGLLCLAMLRISVTCESTALIHLWAGIVGQAALTNDVDVT